MPLCVFILPIVLLTFVDTQQEGFFDAVNSYCAERIDPSSFSCIDKSISRWYGLERCLIDVSLPYYASIARKSKSECELQTLACGNGEFMLQLQLVKTEKERTRLRHIARGVNEEHGHGTEIILRLWSLSMRSRRYICSDSCFYLSKLQRLVMRMVFDSPEL